MVEQGYYAGACEADLKFHEALLECSGNEKLISTYINSHIPLFHRKLTKSAGNDYELTDTEHRAIVKALKEKDLDQAEKIMKMHFARGANMIEFELD